MRKRKKRFLDIGYILTYNMYYIIYFKFCQINKKKTVTNVTAHVYMKGVYHETYYETGILPVKYFYMVEGVGLEPTTFGLSYYYIFICPQNNDLCCSLDYIFIISDG